MRLRPVAALALLVALVGTAAARQELKLVEFVSAEGKYKVLLPPDVKTEKRDIPPGEKNQKMTLHLASAKVGAKSAIAVTHVDVVVPKTPEARVEQLKQVAAGAAEKGKIISDKEHVHGKDKLPGRDALIETPTHFMRYRSVLAGQRLYQIMILGPKELVTSKDADKVLESFEVTK